MPDWNDDEYAPFKIIIETYVNSLNNGTLQNLIPYLASDVVLSRGLTCSGKEKVLSFLENLLGGIKFELLDCSMGFFNGNEAQILLYMQIYHSREKRELHIESLFLNRQKHRWLISRIFGLGFEPEEHDRYFKPFLDDSEKGRT
ncbi:MAG: hypothetical protein KAR40_04440 [Candidatus Sabulitectum sp.]|nr:hypothetical protein [Candidatus Sabulitectum sp.]